MMLHHKDHEYTDASLLILPSKDMMEDSKLICSKISEELKLFTKDLQSTLAKLSKDTNVSIKILMLCHSVKDCFAS
jgi:hypothetical protein